MYQILIADDEVQDRSIIKIFLEKKYRGQFQIMEAENGVQTLEVLNKHTVQLLLLDINMPGLSGIDVLHRLTNRPYVIILTAYNYFDYSREALRCGVREYLLKPPAREEFYKAIDQFINDAEQHNETEGSFESRELFTRDLAKQMMFYGNQRKIAGLLAFLNSTCRYALCGILQYKSERQDLNCVLDEVEEMLDHLETDYAAEVCEGGIAVFLFGNCMDAASEKKQILGFLSNYVENNFCIGVQMRTSSMEPVENYPKVFLKLMDIGNRSIKGQNYISKHMHVLMQEIEQHRDFSRIMDCIHPILEMLDDKEKENIVKSQMIITLSQSARLILPNIKETEVYGKIGGLISAKNREQAEEIVAQYIMWLLEKEKPVMGGYNNDVVESVLKRISANCSQAWSIERLAGELHVNPYYLSHLFREQTGQCFTAYLADLRIERAVNLMKTTNMNFSQIGEQVGYGDPNYFSRIFKKKKGMGLREYLKQIKIAQKCEE